MADNNFTQANGKVFGDETNRKNKMSKVIRLKTIQPYFNDVRIGRKTFELRKDDRDFEVGDKLILDEYDPETDSYSGEKEYGEIIYILRDAPQFGLMEGYCILGLK